MPVGVLPKIAGVPDLKQLERELREWMAQTTVTLNEIHEQLKQMKTGVPRE